MLTCSLHAYHMHSCENIHTHTNIYTFYALTHTSTHTHTHTHTCTHMRTYTLTHREKHVVLQYMHTDAHTHENTHSTLTYMHTHICTCTPPILSLREFFFPSSSCFVIVQYFPFPCQKKRLFSISLSKKETISHWPQLILYASDHVARLLASSLESGDMENSIVAFLLVRQSCAEGAHVFPAYPHWFLVSLFQVTSAGAALMSPWYDCNGWLGVLHQVTYLLSLCTLMRRVWQCASGLAEI